MAMEKGNAPTDRVWAIWFLYAEQFPVAITLDKRSNDDNEPYLVVIGGKSESFCRISEEETEWLIARKVGVR